MIEIGFPDLTETIFKGLHVLHCPNDQMRYARQFFDNAKVASELAGRSEEYDSRFEENWIDFKEGLEATLAPLDFHAVAIRVFKRAPHLLGSGITSEKVRTIYKTLSNECMHGGVGVVEKYLVGGPVEGQIELHPRPLPIHDHVAVLELGLQMIRILRDDIKETTLAAAITEFEESSPE